MSGTGDGKRSLSVFELYMQTVLPEEQNNIIPARIDGKYTHDFDILKIDNIIVFKLNLENKDRAPSLAAELAELQAQIAKPQTLVSRKATALKIESITKEYEDIITGNKLNRYRDLVNPILHRYREVGPLQKVVVFGNPPSPDPIGVTSQDIYRIRAIDDFLDIAKNYLDLDIIREVTPSENCENCGTENTECDGVMLCPRCGLEKGGVCKPRSSSGGTPSTRGEYNDLGNFLKAFSRYQGTQSVKFPKDMFQRLDNFFLSIGSPIGEEIKKLPLNRRGRKGNTDHTMLFDALSACGLAEYYDDANLIGALYWGWKLPSVAHLERTIIEHYKSTQAVYVRLDKERSSSLGTQYRLFRHLSLLGHECYLDEFRVAKSDLSREEHEVLWRQMCEGAGRSDIYYIPLPGRAHGDSGEFF